MAGKEPDYGPTAKTVANNILRLRESQNLTYTQVSDRLTTNGWPLTPVAVRRAEQCERRITVDDLVAFAVALDTSPASLMMPSATSPDDAVPVTGAVVAASAKRAWTWLSAHTPLYKESQYMPFITRSWPAWELEKMSDVLSAAFKKGQEFAAAQIAQHQAADGPTPTTQKPDGDDK
ncbi:helix-turn-helix domain-containing protein [Mycobacteroides abscessus]|nr:helix-turn-helix transcriptional regulator [Mycobacteroides abscessus]